MGFWPVMEDPDSPEADNTPPPPQVSLGKGKRVAAAPLTSSSDEDEPDAPGPEDIPQASPHNSPHHEHDYACPSSSPSLSPGAPSTPTTPASDVDYDNVSSPGSSTASGPTYIRQPGFTHHAHEIVVKSKVKKKKTAVFLSVKDGLKKREPTPPKNKPKRGKFLVI